MILSKQKTNNKDLRLIHYTKPTCVFWETDVKC